MAGPWDILGIAPTPDAAAIRRAYARALKSCRPDEDPDGFQRLVEARTRALAWHWPDPDDDAGSDDERLDEGGADGIVVRFTETEFMALLDGTEPGPEEDGADGAGRFDPTPLLQPLAGQPEGGRQPGFDPTPLLEPLAGRPEGGRQPGFSPPAAFQPGKPDRLARLLKQMAELLHDDGSGVQWDGAAWRGLVQDAGELDLSQRKRLRDAVIRDVLPRLPSLPPYEQVRDDFFADRGPAAAADVLEAEFTFSRDQAQLAAVLGQAATLRFLGWVEHARRALPPSRRTPDQQRALALVARLTGADTAMNLPVRHAWRMEDCQELLTLLAGMTPGEREPCVVALLHELNARLPATLDESVRMFGDIAAVVGAVEAALRFEGPDAVPPGAALPPQYPAWVQAAARLRAARDRLQRGAYRDAHGIPVLPPEDAETGIWAHPRFGEYWAEARKRGRWPVRFDWRAFLFPLTELAALGVGPGLGLALVLLAWIGALAASGLVADDPAGHWVAASCLALFIGARVPFAFLNRRAAVLLAMWRIRRADRDGAASPRSRATRIQTSTGGRQLYRRGFEALCLIGALGTASAALEPASHRAQKFYEQGQDHAARGSHAAAIEDFDRALQLVPNDVRAVYARAVSCFDTGNLHAALAGFTRAVELDPEKADAFIYRGLVLARLNRLDDALRDDGRALELRPGDPVALNNRGLVLERQGNRAGAVEAFTASLTRNPRYGTALVNRGRLFVAAGDADRAMADFTAALGPDMAETPADRQTARLQRGWLHEGRGDYDAAVADFLAVTTMAPWRPEAWRALGYARFYAGAYTEAGHAFLEALSTGFDPYALLFWHLAQSRAGTADLPYFAARSSQLPATEWPHPVMEMFLGQRQPDTLAVAATTDAQRCEAAFYVGEWQLLQGRPGPAAASFRVAVARCPHNFVEYQGAVAELRRLPAP